MNTKLSTEVFQRTMINALEFMDRRILDCSQKTRRFFFQMIPRGVYPLGEGLVRKMHRFYGDRVDQSGLMNWQRIQIGREASGEDPGYNACRYSADMVDSGFETLEFTGFETFKRTKDFCLNDVRYTWEFKQQIALMTSFLADVTVSVWENMAREAYLRACGDAGQIYVIANGAADDHPLQANADAGGSIYDPFETTDIIIERAIDISTLDNWRFFEYWSEYLGLACPGGAVAGTADDPLFGLSLHPRDFQDMILKNDELREDFRNYNPKLLIDKYGAVKEFKGYVIVPDMLAPRFAPKAGGLTSTTIKLERVDPWLKQATTIGEKPVVNPAYLNAEYAMGVIFLKNVVQLLVPPTGPTSLGNGMAFGASPSLMGEFKWLNILDMEKNPLGEVGRYFARYAAFLKPLENSDHAIGFIYKRCVNGAVGVCTPCETTAATATVTAAEAVVDTDAGETSTSYTRVLVTLSACLNVELPAEIGVDYGGGASADVTGVLVKQGSAPQYMLVFATAANYVTAGAIVANTTTVFAS